MHQSQTIAPRKAQPWITAIRRWATNYSVGSCPWQTKNDFEGDRTEQKSWSALNPLGENEGAESHIEENSETSQETISEVDTQRNQEILQVSANIWDWFRTNDETSPWQDSQVAKGYRLL